MTASIVATELSVIIPTHRRNEKLRTLVEGIASTASDRDAIEVVIVVDGEDPAPLEVAHHLPDDIAFQGLTKPHAGPAAARNYAIERANGRWIVFYDDDTRVDAHTLPGHLARIRRDPDSPSAHLGRVDWPTELLDSPFRQMLAGTSMLFFWDRMADEQTYGFRHFWTSNLSVRRDLVQEVGGFNEGFPSAMHEDIELGYRLQEAYGMQVHVDRSIFCLHDHALDPRDYLRRELLSGRSARAARDLNPPFHEQVWGWVHDAEQQYAALDGMFGRSAREVVAMLSALAEPNDRVPTPDEMTALYHAHLPLKRMVFLAGYAGREFDDVWTQLSST